MSSGDDRSHKGGREDRGDAGKREDHRDADGHGDELLSQATIDRGVSAGRDFLVSATFVAVAATLVAGTWYLLGTLRLADGLSPTALSISLAAAAAAIGYLAATTADHERFAIAALVVPFGYVVAVEALMMPETPTHVVRATLLTLGFLAGVGVAIVAGLADGDSDGRTPSGNDEQSGQNEDTEASKAGRRQ